ncbi:copper homeostasis protein CutC [Sphingobacterium pedocola]|uniref:PF03932 family protein CutC n=1 Tax=Sphingobacterium pedocola TaxID=2082722 RepID=A0ABR9T3Q4_9SPHI|nr:copper homeostasis protein CutC [Sphingobacterium pedocola]MBE8719978.1 copper homeostasis protein CutC [Sphingobacterium pedocola]
MAKLEIACFHPDSARIAQENGADRVELCAEMHVGGTSPSTDMVKNVRSQVQIDLNVMIRPRGGDFVYSIAEFEQMKQEIVAFKELAVDGFVFGILDLQGAVNITQNTELVELAHPLPCTFHRAFDVVKNLETALEDVITCGFKAILTSGCAPNVDLGLVNLGKLVKQAVGRITIMPGGGLRSSNITRVLRETGAQYVHSSAITDGSETAVADEVAALAGSVRQA